jgi:hypothetical protein
MNGATSPAGRVALRWGDPGNADDNMLTIESFAKQDDSDSCNTLLTRRLRCRYHDMASGLLINTQYQYAIVVELETGVVMSVG